jgi:hypothetical protein
MKAIAYSTYEANLGICHRNFHAEIQNDQRHESLSKKHCILKIKKYEHVICECVTPS